MAPIRERVRSRALKSLPGTPQALRSFDLSPDLDHLRKSFHLSNHSPAPQALTSMDLSPDLVHLRKSFNLSANLFNLAPGQGPGQGPGRTRSGSGSGAGLSNHSLALSRFSNPLICHLILSICANHLICQITAWHSPGSQIHQFVT